MSLAIRIELLGLLLGTGLLAASGSACLGPQCNDAIAGCETAREQRCHPEQAAVQTCLEDADGCLVWTETAICGPHDKCTAEGGAPVCECDHDCEQHTSQCRGAVIQVCAVDEYGCLYWLNSTDCSVGGLGCEDSSGTAVCGGCQNSCQAFGQSRCSGSVVQTCTNSGDGCLFWQDGNDCAVTGQTCDDSGVNAQCVGECVNACGSAGESRCAGNSIETCATDDSGCLRWELGTDCGANAQVCDDSSGSARCVNQTCSDTCATENGSRCNGTAIETCARGGDGCLHWQGGIDCAATGDECDDSSGSASCTGQCSNSCDTPSATRCQGDAIETCTLGTDGCYAWLQTANCATSSMVCVLVGQAASCQATGGEVALCGLCNESEQCQGYTGNYGGVFCQPLSEDATYWYCLQDCIRDPNDPNDPFDPSRCRSNETCDARGNCIPANGCGVTVCTSYNPNGACPPGLECIGGECRDPGSCHPGNPTGTCPAGLECVVDKCTQTSTDNMPVGGPCTLDEQCAGTNAECYPEVWNEEDTGFLDGYCMIFGCTAGSCPAGSICISLSDTSICMDECQYNSDCREGHLCYSTSGDSGVCWRGCTEGSCPEGYACDDSMCVRVECETRDDCDPGELCVGGRCLVSVDDPPPANPQSIEAALAACSLPPLECSGSASYCGELIQFDPTYGTGYADYPENGETASNQYRSWLRRDAVMLLKYATAYVWCLAESWAGNHYPLGLIDMSERDGSIPGTSVGSPGHPNGTHEDGHDIDVAYYQTGTSDNAARPICTHWDSQGYDQYHCTATPDKLDPWRSALFLGALYNHPALRVVGCDGKAGPTLDSAFAQLCEDGWITSYACSRDKLAYEVTDGGAGWYYFHHHHMHISFGTPAYDYSLWPGRYEQCLVPGCAPVDYSAYLNQPLNKESSRLPRLGDLPPTLLNP